MIPRKNKLLALWEGLIGRNTIYTKVYGDVLYDSSHKQIGTRLHWAVAIPIPGLQDSFRIDRLERRVGFGHSTWVTHGAGFPYNRGGDTYSQSDAMSVLGQLENSYERQGMRLTSEQPFISRWVQKIKDQNNAAKTKAGMGK